MYILKHGIPLLLFLLLIACKPSSSQTETKSNHLIKEHSTYLLQHAHNPVDWYPWSDEALAKAVKENKLIIVSIGYSSCHWCHVMEKESFSDTAVSRIMNANFVSIKVDREERPDIDNIYMEACQIVNQNGGCGWPLNAICLSDGRPVWVGTYLTKNEWMHLLNQILDVYKEDQNQLQKAAAQIANHLQSEQQFNVNDQELRFESKFMTDAHARILASLDFQNGGRSGQIKFPLPPLLEYNLEYAFATKDIKTKQWLDLSLTNMMEGGIYDQLAGGFARYSTDAKWNVPHFEKMLYDNAQLISIYANAYRFTNNQGYKNLITDCTKFMFNEFKSPEAAYYSSFDADSEGEEGKFYVWTLNELKTMLPDANQLKLVIDHFDITEAGNWEHGKNVLKIHMTQKELALKYKITETEVGSQLENAKQQMLAYRNKRTKPGRDEKIICSWNAMMVQALCDVYAATSDKSYLDEAIKTANFIKTKLMQNDLKLFRSYMKGKTGAQGFLDDYAFTILAMIRLYEVSFDESWLQQSKAICDVVIKNFTDEFGLLFYYTSSEDKALIARKKELSDQVIASSNSLMCEVLHKLGLYFYNESYLDRSKKMLHAIAQQQELMDPIFISNWLRIQIGFVKPLYEVAIVGKDFAALHTSILNKYTPNAILLGGASEGSLELLKEKLQEDQTYIYVCRNKVCKLPVQDVSKAIQLMN